MLKKKIIIKYKFLRSQVPHVMKNMKVLETENWIPKPDLAHVNYAQR